MALFGTSHCEWIIIALRRSLGKLSSRMVLFVQVFLFPRYSSPPHGISKHFGGLTSGFWKFTRVSWDLDEVPSKKARTPMRTTTALQRVRKNYKSPVGLGRWGANYNEKTRKYYLSILETFFIDNLLKELPMNSI